MQPTRRELFGLVTTATVTTLPVAEVGAQTESGDRYGDGVYGAGLYSTSATNENSGPSEAFREAGEAGRFASDGTERR
ncbi:hypothetical protein Halxa_3147 [Halopiger xanaduensis SH-6]|uniref:Uncharacterized protein n=1 Tax=Halopiger xanaduensis (strain DSM 18323 / JCM 14033 / SH-6) TaxID=797210 RepID=F8D6M0_HALXS|nr:hypothetical protein Halxa_3147 [Halopiger xanaduensis SH-6]